MATLICSSNGNSTGSIWGTVDTTSLLDSESNSTASTTSYVESSTFTPGAITIDGFAVKIAARTSGGGTLSLRIAQAAATVAGTEVIVNVADVQGTVNDTQGWFFVKFAAPVTLIAATAYTVSLKTSVAGTVTLYRNATTANFSRMLRTTTNTTIAAGDNFFVLGEWTAAGTSTARTVTWVHTAATDFGGASTTIASVGVGQGGTIIFGTTAATAYVFQCSGIVRIYSGGTLQMGTTSTQCPRDSSMTLQFDCAADGDFGLIISGGTWSGQGLPRLSGSTNHFTLLAADASAAATSLTTTSQLSAKNGDDVALATTTRTNSQCETKALSADAGATSLSIAAITNAHSGTSPTQAEVAVLSRAVRVVSVSSANMAYIQVYGGANVDLDWVEIRYCGQNAVAAKSGIYWNDTGQGSVITLDKCCIRDWEGTGFHAVASCGSFAVRDTVFFGTAGQGSFVVNGATTATWIFTGNVSITTSCLHFNINDLGGTVDDNRFAGGTVSNIGEISGGFPGLFTGSFARNVFHGGGSSNSISLKGAVGFVFDTLSCWRNTGSLLVAETTAGGHVSDLRFLSCTFFGNGTASVLHSTAVNVAENVLFRSCNFNGDSTFSTPIGVSINGCRVCRGWRFESCNFGVASGILVTHSTADISIGAYCLFDITTSKTKLSSGTPIASISNGQGRSAFHHQRLGDVANADSSVYPQLGTVQKDTTTYKTASPSLAMLPTLAVSSFKLESKRFRRRVTSGSSITVAVYVQKNGSYNGNAPRLRVAQNSAGGIAEATLATHSAGASTWQQISGSVGPVAETCYLEFFVDCDGSAGQVNVDDWSIT